MQGIQWLEMCPKMYVTYLSSFRPILKTVHPDTAKKILITSEPKPTSQGGSYANVLPWLGNGLLTASGKKWARNQKLLTPGFHFDILRSHIDIHNTCVEIMLQRIEEECAGSSIEICKPISALTLDVIVKCVFSLKESIQIHDEQQYLETVEEIKMLIVKRFMNPLLYIDTVYYLTSGGQRFKKLVDISHGHAMKMIKSRRHALSLVQNKTAAKYTRKCMDFLDILLLAKDDNGEGLTDLEILDEVETFMFEGHDTTSAGISWLLYNLASNLEYQEKVQAEIDSVIGHKSTNMIEWDDLGKFPYLTMCIKESLRMHPPVPFIGRQLTSPLIIDNKEFPVGTFIDISIWLIHHNSSVWGSDHMTYDPERFSAKCIAQIDPFAFVPFSAGPRNCIGQNFAMNELKIVTGRILQQFSVSLDETHEVRMKPELILKAENGIKLYFTKRH